MSMANETSDGGKELTGRKVLIIVVSFFAVIIGVNIFMAWSAIGTFPGLEVKNTYVASQSFDAERAAQEALGWEVSAEIVETALRLDIRGPDGAPAEVSALNATLGRATQRTDDQDLMFSQNSLGAHVANVGAIDVGKWELRLFATAGDGTPFRQRIELIVPES